jgi:hypothetical protein
MANELQFDAGPQLSGINCYALLRDTVGRAWNGSSFVAYATADYATYAVALAEQGTASGYYTATMPTVIDGVYYVSVHQRAGVSPAESDTRIGLGEIDWDGSAVRTLLTGAEIAGALLDLADGIEPGVTPRQALRLIAAALAGRRSNVGTATEQYDAAGNPGTPRVVGNLDASGNGTPTLTP